MEEKLQEIKYRKARSCFNCKHISYNEETRENICSKHNIPISIVFTCKNFAKEKVSLSIVEE